MKSLYIIVLLTFFSLSGSLFAGGGSTPPANDDCSTATLLTVGTSCTFSGSTTANATASSTSGTPAPGCASYSGGDVWFKFVAPAGGAVTIDTDVNQISDGGMALYSGSCGSLSLVECDDDDSDNGLMPKIIRTGLTSGNTYYVRFWEYSNDNPGTFKICVTQPAPPPSNDECTGATALTINSYGSCTSETAGTINSATASAQANNCYGTDDDDVWYYFTATSTAHTVGLNSVTGSTTDMMYSVFSSGGSCASLNTTNIACEEIYTSGSTNVTGLTVGNRYYVRVYSWTSSTGQNSNFNICVQSPPSCPGNLGTGNVSVTSLPYAASNQSPSGDEITASNVVSCGDSYYFGDRDKVYYFTPATTGNVSISISSATNYVGATLFNGCPFSGTCVDYVQSYATGSKGFCTSVTAGNTYYLVVDSDNGTSGFNFDINISSIFAGQPNDLPCNATTLLNGVSSPGDLDCTGGSGEPAAPSCWTSGTINSVWYKFQASSTSMYLQTTLGTASSTQIAVYSGTCGSSMTLVGCNQDAGSTGCAGTSTQNSLLDLTTLTIGTWYYVRVDGENNITGTFNIILNDGTSTTTNDALLGQDCASPLPICSGSVTVPNPSYAGTGNICDFTGTNNCTSGEKNSVWYTFEIGANGNLNFTIRPNDLSGTSPSGAETDYDWVLWKLTNANGSTNTTCATLNAAAPISCNYGYIGVTGISSGGNSPSPYTGVDSYFEPTVSVTAGEKYLLVVQNFETTSSGFTLEFNNTNNPSSAGVIDNTPNTIYWNGATNTNFNTNTNYSGCNVTPACGINVVVNPAANQPTLTTTQGYTTNSNTTLGGAYYHVNDLTINSGAILTLQAGVTLEVCGSFTNYGTLVCSPTSTVVFVDGSNTTQYITGSLINSNKFGNVTVTKAGGSVICNNNITIGGTFTTSNPTSIFNSNNKYIRLAGHFYNNKGNSTYTNTGTVGTLEFLGTGLQNYNQGTTQLDLNNVVLNNTAGIGNGVTLQTDMFIKATTGTLTLTNGTITTGGTLNTTGSATIVGGYKVHVVNETPACVTVGTTGSFVDGTLRRYVNGSGDYNWPVGNVVKGYQRAETNFSTIANAMDYIDVRFDLWPLPCTTNYSECAKLYDQPSMNNGIWTFLPNGGTCTYDGTLYPTNVTNIVGAAWTIIKRPHTSAIDNTGWVLNGTCATSTSSVVTRTGMTNFSFLAVDQGIVSTPIELINFTAKNEGSYNLIEWETAAERENDYFIIEKSKDGKTFDFLAKIEGAGNSSTNIVYKTKDEKPINGINYYRLKQADFNGEIIEQGTRMVKNELNSIFVSSIYPNPSGDQSSVNFYTPVDGDVKINIIDNSGRLVSSKSLHVKEGNTIVNLNSNELVKGIYTVEISFSKDNFKSVEKFIKQ